MKTRKNAGKTIAVFICLLQAAALFRVQADALYHDAIFEGNAQYLMQEHFAAPFGTDISGRLNFTPSGWDIDHRGGRTIFQNGVFSLLDGDDTGQIKMNKKFIPHTTGALVFETAFSIDGLMASGFYYKISGGAADALTLKVSGGALCVLDYMGRERVVSSCEANVTYYIKAVFSLQTQTVSLSVNGQAGRDFAFQENTPEISGIEIGTGIAEDMVVSLRFVNFYINYYVNERFITAPAGTIPVGWRFSGDSQSGVSRAFGSRYADDPNGFALVNSAQTPSASLSAPFSAESGKLTACWNILVPDAHDGWGVSLKRAGVEIIAVKGAGGRLVANGTAILSDYRPNMWYNIRLELDANEGVFDAFVNHRQAAARLSFPPGAPDEICFFKTDAGFGRLLIDDAAVYNKYKKPADYPAPPVAANSDGYHVGMQMYSMWREGTHYGWDAIAPYEDERKPYLGYYTEGSVEAADWENKWLLEHGVDYAVYPFVRPASPAGEPVKLPVRSEALHDGYFHSEYGGQLKFAILLSSFSSGNYFGAAEFIENVLPYLTEYYFKNPGYMTVNNKPVVYAYDIKTVINTLGGGNTQQGIIETNAVVAALDAAVRTLGFDGVIFAADISNKDAALAQQITGAYEWWYAFASGFGMPKYIAGVNTAEFEAGRKVIASVPMGFDYAPWAEPYVGQAMMTPGEIALICDRVKDAMDTYAGNERMITFTCWNEYGEGHFYAPSAKSGFDYLGVIREEFTAAGAGVSESVPGEAALARMGALYPKDRGALKTKSEGKLISDDALATLSTAKRFGFSSALDVLRWSRYRVTASYDSRSKTMECTATGVDPQLYLNVAAQNIGAADIRAVRIRMYSVGGRGIRLYYTTTNDAIYNAAKSFSGYTDATDEYADYILVPENEASLSGMLTNIRVDPDDYLADYGGRFGIESIEILTGSPRLKVRLDDREIKFVSEPVVGDTVYIPAYYFMLNDLSAYVTWDMPSKELRAEKDGKLLTFRAGSSLLHINGVAKQMSGAAFYQKGNLFVPYDAVEELGLRAEYSAQERTLAFYTPYYGALVADAENPYVWSFNVPGNCEGWTGVNLSKLTVSGGALRVSPSTAYPHITSPPIAAASSEYRYAVVVLKNTARNVTASLRISNPAGDMLSYPIALRANGMFEEYVVDLSANAHYASFGEIASIRFDPMGGFAVTQIDSIGLHRAMEDYRMKITLVEYEWGPNIAPRLSEATGGYFVTYNAAAGYDNEVLEVIPSAAGTDALLIIKNVLYKGAHQPLKHVCQDGRTIRVTFSYKSRGNCGRLEVENRQSAAIDAKHEIPGPISPAQWNRFEGEFDLSGCVTAANEERWLAIRIKTLPAQANPGVFIKDLQISCREEKEAEPFAGQPMVVRLDAGNYTPQAKTIDCTLYIAGYGSGGVLTRVTAHPERIALSAGGSFRKDYAAGLSGGDVKTMLWRDMDPLLHPVEVR